MQKRYVISETTLIQGAFCNQPEVRLPVSKLWLKRWFSFFLVCLTLTLHFKVIWFFENSPFVSVHDWCTFWGVMFIDSGDIAHWNMKNSLYFIMGIFRCHGNVCYYYLIDAFFASAITWVHVISVSILRTIGWHFRSWFPFFINSTISHR